MTASARKLILLRHAKSDWDAPYNSDFDRPLNERGKLSAPLIGEYARDKNVTPDMIISSPALRTRQTCQLFIEAFGNEIKTQFEERLYGAHTDDIIDIIRKCPDNILNLLIIGHNPGLASLAYNLSPSNAETFGKFPTASFAVFNVQSDRWSEITPSVCSLFDFVKPRDLA